MSIEYARFARVFKKSLDKPRNKCYNPNAKGYDGKSSRRICKPEKRAFCWKPSCTSPVKTTPEPRGSNKPRRPPGVIGKRVKIQGGTVHLICTLDCKKHLRPRVLFVFQKSPHLTAKPFNSLQNVNNYLNINTLRRKK